MNKMNCYSNPSLINAKLLPRKRRFADAEVHPPIRRSVRDERCNRRVEWDVLQNLDCVTSLQELQFGVVNPAAGDLERGDGVPIEILEITILHLFISDLYLFQF